MFPVKNGQCLKELNKEDEEAAHRMGIFIEIVAEADLLMLKKIVNVKRLAAESKKK